MLLGSFLSKAFLACPAGRTPQGTLRTYLRDCTAPLTQECLRIPQEEPGNVAVIPCFELRKRDGWMCSINSSPRVRLSMKTLKFSANNLNHEACHSAQHTVNWKCIYLALVIDLVLGDFVLFPKMKLKLNVCDFNTVEETYWCKWKWSWENLGAVK